MSDQPTKLCSKCGEEKPRTEFGINNSYDHRPGSLNAYCKPCHRKAALESKRQKLALTIALYSNRRISHDATAKRHRVLAALQRLLTD